MATDALATHVAMASAAMVLIIVDIRVIDIHEVVF